MGASTDKEGADRRKLESENSSMRSDTCCRSSLLGAELGSAATSQLVPTAALLTARLAFLLVLVLGGIWITRRSSDPPLCLPDWGYIATTLYFAVRRRFWCGKQSVVPCGISR